MVEVCDTFGLWERRLLAWPDGRRDTSTAVAWLQGPSLFIDLRQPEMPDFLRRTSCLGDLGRDAIDWLSTQEGFAGRFVRVGDAFEWQRQIDFQCPSEVADAGFLAFEGEVMTERGRDVDYLEHWFHASRDLDPHYAVRMTGAGGRAGSLVRAGGVFMFARDRVFALPRGGSLQAMVRAAGLEAARGLIDCEISLGQVTADAWTVTRSTLPFRVGKDLRPRLFSGGETMTTMDTEGNGEPVIRQWSVVEFETRPAGGRDL